MMSTVVDTCPQFSAHALVRYIERSLDAAAVRQARRRYEDDHAILAILQPAFEKELSAYVDRVRSAIAAWARRAPLPGHFRIRFGEVVAVICAGTCVTTLPRRRHKPVRSRSVSPPRGEVRRAARGDARFSPASIPVSKHALSALPFLREEL